MNYLWSIGSLFLGYSKVQWTFTKGFTNQFCNWCWTPSCNVVRQPTFRLQRHGCGSLCGALSWLWAKWQRRMTKKEWMGWLCWWDGWDRRTMNQRFQDFMVDLQKAWGRFFWEEKHIEKKSWQIFFNHAMFPIHWALFQDISFNSLTRLSLRLLKVFKVNISKHPHFAY